MQEYVKVNLFRELMKTEQVHKFHQHIKRLSVGRGTVGDGTGEDGSWQLGGKYKQVSSCKLKVSGKDWLLPNIQSRKHQAFAAAGGEEKVLSKSQDSPNIL